MVTYLEKYVTILKQNQLKITPQRLAIMKYLDENRTHPTADRIYIDLKEKNPALSKTTVYNSVETLKEHGIIKEKNPALSKTTVYNSVETLKEHGIIQSLTISGSESRYDFENKTKNTASFNHLQFQVQSQDMTLKIKCIIIFCVKNVARSLI